MAKAPLGAAGLAGRGVGAGPWTAPGASGCPGQGQSPALLCPGTEPCPALAGDRALPAAALFVRREGRGYLARGPRRVWPPGSAGLGQLPPVWLRAREETGWGDVIEMRVILFLLPAHSTAISDDRYRSALL